MSKTMPAEVQSEVEVGQNAAGSSLGVVQQQKRLRELDDALHNDQRPKPDVYE